MIPHGCTAARLVTDPPSGDLRVLVLAGACPTSGTSRCAPAAGCSTRCAPSGVEAELRDADVALLPALAADPPDAVVIALHGATGEDGSLRGVLDLCGVPVRRLRRPRRPARLGQAVRQGGAARGRHPHPRLGGAAARPVLRARRGRRARPDRRPARPAADGEAGAGRLRPGRRRGPRRGRAAGRDGRLLRVRPDRAGRAVRRRAWTSRSPSSTSATGRRRCPPVEIVPRNGVYDYAARYTAGLTTWHAPARLDAGGGRARWPRRRSPRTTRSACATCPGST